MRIHQPIPETAGRVATPDGTAQVMPYQTVVKVSSAANSVMGLPSDAPRFPAVLDTGNSHNFAIRREQFARWTGLTLPKRGLVNVGGRTIPLYAANLWIHPNHRDAFRLRMEEGIVVYTSNVPNPARLPILGLRGLVRNGLRLVIDGKSKEFTINTSLSCCVKGRSRRCGPGRQRRLPSGARAARISGCKVESEGKVLVSDA